MYIYSFPFDLVQLLQNHEKKPVQFTYVHQMLTETYHLLTISNLIFLTTKYTTHSCVFQLLESIQYLIKLIFVV